MFFLVTIDDILHSVFRAIIREEKLFKLKDQKSGYGSRKFNCSRKKYDFFVSKRLSPDISELSGRQDEKAEGSVQNVRGVVRVPSCKTVRNNGYFNRLSFSISTAEINDVPYRYQTTRKLHVRTFRLFAVPTVLQLKFYFSLSYVQ